MAEAAGRKAIAPTPPMSAGELGRVAAALDDPFSGDIAGGTSSRSFKLAPGWTASAAVSSASRAESERRSPLDRAPDSATARLTRSFASGGAVSGSVESTAGLASYTLEARKEFKKSLPRGRSVSSTIEVGWEGESATGRGSYAAFAGDGGPPLRPGQVPVAKNTFWVNWKTGLEVAPQLSLTAEFEAEDGSDGRETLAYFGLRKVW